ncbi:MAG TPA: hypothetical protein VHR72_01795 [Gemmataceae bacterium]|jgi:hypothetical protein|nr:hypothetical protein [Gemmataceae bacterium]
MILPHADAVVVAKEKITEYLLNPLHPDGASKATFFATLGFKNEEWSLLAEAFKELALRFDIVKSVASPHGTKFVVDGVLATPGGKMPKVRTIWIVDDDEQTPRLVTAYPLEHGA